MNNFLKPRDDDKNLRGNTDWKAQIKTLGVSFVTCKFENFFQQLWNYKFERKFNKYSEER